MKENKEYFKPLRDRIIPDRDDTIGWINPQLEGVTGQKSTEIWVEKSDPVPVPEPEEKQRSRFWSRRYIPLRVIEAGVMSTGLAGMIFSRNKDYFDYFPLLYFGGIVGTTCDGLINLAKDVRKSRPQDPRTVWEEKGNSTSKPEDKR